MAKHLFQIIVIGSQIIGKSLIKSIKEEIHLSQEAAKHLQQNPATKTTKNGLLSLREAQEILDLVKNINNKQEIDEKFKFLFEANSDKRGGNLYIRSKIVRAKERLIFEINNTPPNSKKTKKG